MDSYRKISHQPEAHSAITCGHVGCFQLLIDDPLEPLVKPDPIVAGREGIVVTVMTELLVGTKKGLFALQGADGPFEIAARSFAGEPVEFATRDPRSGRYFASVTSACSSVSRSSWWPTCSRTTTCRGR